MSKQKRHIELNNQVTRRTEDGFFDLEKDIQAKDAFIEEVKSKTKKFPSELERLKWMVNNDFYYDLFKQYGGKKAIEKLLDRTVNVEVEEPFEFKSYMAASKFYSGYVAKTNDGKTYLENYEQHVFIVAAYLAQGDSDQAVKHYWAMYDQVYQPATPTFMNAGRSRRGELVSCFLLSTGDSLNGINYTESTTKQLSKLGGGIATDLTNIRSRGSSIKGIEGVAKGALPVAKAIQNAVGYADQLGQRPGAAAVYINVFHMDSLEILDSKKVNADEDVRLSTVSIGLIAPTLFFEIAERNETLHMFDPLDVKRVTGQELGDVNIADVYDELVSDSSVRKKTINAREYLETIAKTQKESGYPYVMFKDNANKQHPLKNIGEVKMSNLCTEIFQLQETSVINDYGIEDEINRDISCNLGSINIANAVEKGEDFGDYVESAIRSLTSVSDMTSIANAPGVRKANEELHSVGLGAMNLHGFLAKNSISYESVEARDFANVFFATLRYHSLLASSKIAYERKETFKDFDKSDYADGSYFDNYIENTPVIKTDKVREIIESNGFHIPTKQQWMALRTIVMQNGLYNAYLNAIAPTQSISYVQNATSAISPIVDLIERRTYGDSETFYPMPYLSPQSMWFYKSAYNIDQYRLIDLVSVVQRHVDQGVSTILYVTSDTSTRELASYYIYAHAKGLKSLYYTRNKLLSIEECTSCAV